MLLPSFYLRCIKIENNPTYMKKNMLDLLNLYTKISLTSTIDSFDVVHSDNQCPTVCISYGTLVLDLHVCQTISMTTVIILY